MPTSVNAMHQVSKGFFNRKTKKYERVNSRSKEYIAWLEQAAVAYRNLYPGGVQKFTGRLRVDYIFIWHESDKGRNSSDLSNREKCLSDFLEGKLFANDNQIDEQHHYRRITAEGISRVRLRVYEIPDRRYDCPYQIF